jgi:hypothetical protein
MNRCPLVDNSRQITVNLPIVDDPSMSKSAYYLAHVF